MPIFAIISAFCMCLEDEFIKVLYTYETTVASHVLAQKLGISENALCSIINRVKMSYPHFIMENKDDRLSRLSLCPNKMAEKEVLLFLAEGGFTSINEKEIREYEEALQMMETKETPEKIRMVQHRPQKKAITWMVVTAGVVTLSFNYFRRLIARK